MGGGLMQLVAYGVQDIYLTGNPQITFFKVVYRRHTNFSMESIQQTWNGTADFGGTVTATISRNGDLVHRMYLEHDVVLKADQQFGPSYTETGYINICSNYGSNLIKECELEIGGQRIDKHYSHWHSVYSQLTEFNPTGANDNGYPVPSGGHETNSITRSTLFNTMSGNGGAVTTGVSPDKQTNVNLGSWTMQGFTTAEQQDKAETRIFIPLYFWFCRNPGLALPLIALQYHEVKVKMTFDGKINLHHNWYEKKAGIDGGNNQIGDGGQYEARGWWPVTSAPANFDLYCDYIYLDTDERRRFAQVSHEYLIEQVQYQRISQSGPLNLNFNHPVKELIWTSGNNSDGDSIGIFGHTYNAPGSNMLSREPKSLSGTFQLKLNGHDRFKERDVKYFTRTQIWQHHTGYGSTINADAIAVYSFALKPEEHQPSGTCNFSRIDNAQLTASNKSSDDSYNVYAVNYNVLRIMSGMGGLAYSN